MTILCSKCSEHFEPAPWKIKKGMWICNPCLSIYGKGYRANRKQNGRPVVSGKVPPSYHQEYATYYNSKPEVRKRKAELSRIRARHPDEIFKNKARAETKKAIRSGILVRKPCEVCGLNRVDAHHDDYTQPLKIRWLCRKHHSDHHRATGEQP